MDTASNQVNTANDSRRARGQTSPSPGRADEHDVLVQRLHRRGFGTDQHGCMLGVTSTRQGEGVTSLVANLAARVARVHGSTVLMIDANFSHPCLHHLFQLDPGPGLWDGLEADLPPAQLVQPTAIENLSLVAAGEMPVGLGQGLATSRMFALLDELSAAHDWVVIDLPAVATPSPLLRHVSKLQGVLFVVGAERVSGAAAARAKAQLEELGANVLGAVLTMRRNYLPSWLAGGDGEECPAI